MKLVQAFVVVQETLEELNLNWNNMQLSQLEKRRDLREREGDSTRESQIKHKFKEI